MMRPPRSLLLRLAVLAALALPALGAAPCAAAQAPAAPDSGLTRYLGGLSDSTDAYFGDSAAPTDTAALDSVLFDSTSRPRRMLGWGVAPSFTFDRVNGSTPGASAWLGETQPQPGRTGLGRLTFGWSRANGPRENLGGVRYASRVWLARQPFDLDLWGGRRTSNMDRDASERLLPLVRALFWGADWTHYYRTDGFRAALEHPHGWWRAGLAYQDVLQRPLAVTATWNVFGRDLDMPFNLRAARGHLHEVAGGLFVRWPRTPLRTEVTVQRALEGDRAAFDYTRWRAAAGLDVTVGRWASLVPEAAYGRLSGRGTDWGGVPQAEFYLGGDGTLRSLEREQLAGTGMAIGKLTLVGAQPVLPFATLPMVPEAFVASGAAWRHAGTLSAESGRGVVLGKPGWAESEEWRTEVGLGLVYRSPIFPGGGALHFDYAWPVGGHAGPGRLSVSFTRPFDLMGPEPEPIEEQ